MTIENRTNRNETFYHESHNKIPTKTWVAIWIAIITLAFIGLSFIF